LLYDTISTQSVPAVSCEKFLLISFSGAVGLSGWTAICRLNQFAILQ
jgi:hypothetical protein